MNISMYQASAPRFANTLKNLSAILDKAQAHADSRKIDPAVRANSRPYPDLFQLKSQVTIAWDTTQRPIARPGGGGVPKH